VNLLKGIGSKMKNRNWLQSFGHAIDGICKTAKSERNFRIQLFFAILAVIACIVFRVELWQIGLVTVGIFFVLIMELVNTAIEALTDLSCDGKIHPLAKTAKDAAAGAVLLASVFAIVVAVIVAIDVIKRYI